MCHGFVRLGCQKLFLLLNLLAIYSLLVACHHDDDATDNNNDLIGSSQCAINNMSPCLSTNSNKRFASCVLRLAY